jgi:hypothetical protein
MLVLASVQENDDLGVRKLGPKPPKSKLAFPIGAGGTPRLQRELLEDWLKNHTKDPASVLPSTALGAVGGVMLHRFPTNHQKNTHCKIALQVIHPIPYDL